MAANRIVLIECGQNQYEEAIAVGACKPGHQLIIDSNLKVAVGPASGIRDEMIIAIENSIGGNAANPLLAGTITTAYAVGELVRMHKACRGDVLYVRVSAAAPAIVKGDKLMADGTGCFVKVTTTLWFSVKALESVDNSGGSGEVFIKVRVL